MSPAFHVANALFLASYLVKDILWLRVFAVVASLCLLWVSLGGSTPSYEAAAWNALFLAINIVRIVMLIRERRPVKLSELEARIWELAFRTLTPRELKALLALGAFFDAPEGELLVAQGTHPGRVMILAEGRVAVSSSGKALCELSPGSFVGEMSFLTGDAPRADVHAVGPCKLFAWPKDALARMLKEHPELRAQVQMAIGQDLVAKLRST
jgi:hypothetical protein